MPGPFFRVELHLIPAEKGGRKHPLRDDYRPNWELGNTWLGEPMLHDGRVFLEDTTQLPPGRQGNARVEPLRPEYWGGVGAGRVLAVQEGARMVGHATVLEVVAKPAYWSPAAAAFVCQAWQFCAFVEKAHEYSLGERLRVARQQLTSLYDCATLLPDTQATEGDEPVTPGAPSQWPGFERFEAYWEVFDPYQRSTPVGGSLSDDVLDIYGDLRRGLSLWDTEASRPRRSGTGASTSRPTGAITRSMRSGRCTTRARRPAGDTGSAPDRVSVEAGCAPLPSSCGVARPARAGREVRG